MVKEKTNNIGEDQVFGGISALKLAPAGRYKLWPLWDAQVAVQALWPAMSPAGSTYSLLPDVIYDQSIVLLKKLNILQYVAHDMQASPIASQNDATTKWNGLKVEIERTTSVWIGL